MKHTQALESECVKLLVSEKSFKLELQLSSDVSREVED